MSDWPKGPTSWMGDLGELIVSIPFTWNLKPVRDYLRQRHLFFDHATVGGPAIKLSRSKHFKMPFEWPDHVTVDTGDMAGVLERANPLAMRTSTGCTNKCGYCAVPTIEPRFSELEIHEARPIVCDNNFLACSESHRRQVYLLLERDCKGQQIDFNQGLDARLMTKWDAEQLRRLKAKCRLAYDYETEGDAVRNAVDILRAAGVPKKDFSFYALVGWKDTPEQAWKRCLEIDSWNMLCCPMWFHELDAMRWNEVTKKQKALGWTEEKRLHIMGYFWQHRGTPLEASV